MQHFTSVEALIQFVEGQSHRQRCQTLLECGHSSMLAAAPDSTTIQHIICELAQPAQVHYYRLLAAYALRGAFAVAKSKSTPVDGALWKAALSLLNDPSEKVAHLVMMPLLTAPTPLLSTSFSLSFYLNAARMPQFKSFAWKLRQCGHQKLLADVYTSKAVADMAKQQYLLGYLSPTEFEKLSEEDQASLDSTALQLLCRFHGAWVAEYLTRRVKAQVAATQTVDALLKRHVMHAFAAFASYSGGRHALALFTATGHLIELEQFEVTNVLSSFLFCAYPVEVGTYLLDGEGKTIMARCRSPINCELSRLAAKRLKGQTDLILRMMEGGILESVQCVPFFLPREVRQRLYDTQRSSMAEDNGVLSSKYVLWLPRAEDRMAEARASYAHRALQDDPHDRLWYLRLLPFPEALKLAEDFTASNDVNIRMSVVTSLLYSLRYFPAHVDAALDFCLHRTKEQDPWKTTMYEAWNDLPQGFWRRTGAHLSDAILQKKFQQLIDATYSAKDLSERTLSILRELLFSLVGSQPSFALPQLIKLIHTQKSFCSSLRRGGPFDYVALLYPQVLPDVAATILPVGQAFLQKDDSYSYVNVLESFLDKDHSDVARVLIHKRSNSGDAQQVKTQQLVKATLSAGMNSGNRIAATTAFEFYCDHFPTEAVANLPSMVEKNLDWVTHERVQSIICNILQGPLLDRLVTFVSGIPFGRLYTPNDKKRPYFCQLPLSYAHRWTAHQQQTYAETILKIIYGKSKTGLYNARDYVMALARLPSVLSSCCWTSPKGTQHSLLTLASEQHPHYGKYLRGFALQALGFLDGDEAAMKTLQAALEMPDSRIDALRALTRTLRRASTMEAVRVLEPLLTGKHITTQKEALYFLGSKRDEVAYNRLVKFTAERFLPMPNVDTEGNVIPNSAGEAEKSAAASEAEKPRAMHRDVRTALVKTLFQYLSKPQVWAYFDALVEWDCRDVETENNNSDTDTEDNSDAGREDNSSEETAATDSTGAEESADNSDHAKAEEGEGEAEKKKSYDSAAACEAMTKLPWTNLPLLWQLRRYQTLLTKLLYHPKRNVQVAALKKLASVPPYINIDLCHAAAGYLASCTSPSLVQPALQCMMSCTAEETIPYVISVILNVQPDASLQIVTRSFTSLANEVNVSMQPRYFSVIEGVVAQLTAARRQPMLIVEFISALPAAQIVAQLTVVESAGILHIGAAHAAVEAVRNGESLMRDPKVATEVELSMLRHNPSALLRRMGLEVVLQALRRKGWTDERRTAVAAYRQDSDLWVSSDAMLVRME